MRDTRPECGYQVGPTPEGTELPRSSRDRYIQSLIENLPPESQPHDFRQKDPKWRFFHAFGPRPEHHETKFPLVNPSPVVPQQFTEWPETVDSWGCMMHSAVETVAEMLAVGFGLPKDTFTRLCAKGPHLVAPTAANLKKHGQLGKTLAGYHQDLNFITIHGKSRFPGLYIWLKGGKKMLVRIPDGCLLLQAGMQLAYVTGNTIPAGFHEVVVTEETLEAMQRAEKAQQPSWRISSTFFYHMASDELLRPLAHFETSESADNFPPIYVGDFVQRELQFINLMSAEH